MITFLKLKFQEFVTGSSPRPFLAALFRMKGRMTMKDMFEKRSAPKDEKAKPRVAAVNRYNNYGTTALFEAIEKGSVYMVEKLIAQGADFEQRTVARGKLSRMMYDVPLAPGSTPLHAAALFGHTDIIDLLIERRADVNAVNSEGRTPLDEAINSYEFYKNKLEKSLQSRLSRQFSATKTAVTFVRFENAILQLLEAGGKTGIFHLPEEFKHPKTGEPAAVPTRKFDLPDLP